MSHNGIADVFDRLKVEIDGTEAMRYLGYPARTTPHPEVSRRLDVMLDEVRRAMVPRGTYSLYDVEAIDDHSVLLAGGGTFHGSIGDFLKGSERVAVFVITAGPEVGRLSDDCWKAGDGLGGWIYSSLGSQVAEGAADALETKLRRHLRKGEEITLRYSPGYCGMDLREQIEIFRLADASAIGVRLTSALLMEPLKSISGLIGLGPQGKIGRRKSPCEHCTRVGCHMRR